MLLFFPLDTVDLSQLTVYITYSLITCFAMQTDMSVFQTVAILTQGDSIKK